MYRFFLSLIYIAIVVLPISAQSSNNSDKNTLHNTALLAMQEHSEEGDKHEEEAHAADDHSNPCAHHASEFDPKNTAFHHISDANIYSIGPFNFPLPCFLYAPGEGWSFFSSKIFGADSHGNGHMAHDRYILDEGSVRRVDDSQFPGGDIEIDGIVHKEEEINGKMRQVSYVCYNNELYKADAKSTADAGVFGGGITSFYDFSLTKNVVSMLIVTIFLMWMFLSIAKSYKRREGQAPKGIQSFIEPMFLFIQDEVAKPFLGDRWEKYQPLLMALFFFILALNLFGQIPFFGGSNVMGNMAVTMVLAIIAFVVTNFSGKRDYWQHIFWMPGIPALVKTIITPVEILGLFIKPVTLMLRLFANVTAGHIVVVVFVGLIFIFGGNGANVGASYGTAIGSILLTLFMMAIELLVAFIQAFVFTILTASYIGAATEEHH